ncbi:MAG TPA: Sec-independent protein translocase subunit TatA [Mycobacteriales bacterium]|nr:Sec-independent protein translocase subunit TatA [Mycobacteriales bacterium]
MGEFGPWHLLIVAAVFVLLFGAKKLPDAARSLGRSARILKTELKDLHDDDGTKAQPVQQAALPVAPAAPVAPAVTSDPPPQPVASGDQSPPPQ